LLCLAVIAACGGTPRLAVAPKAAVNLTGEWVLDRAHSDDVRARIRPMFARKERELNRYIQRAEEDGDTDEPIAPPADAAKPPQSDVNRKEPHDDSSTVQWLRRQQRIEAEAIIAFLSPASELKIDKRNAEYRFLSDKGEGTRRFVPGERSSVFNGFGGFEVMSGWEKSSFVVSSEGKGDNRIRLLERYTVLADGALEGKVVAHLPNLGKYEYRFLYRRRS